MKAQPRTVWQLIRQVVKGDPLAKQYERVEDAVKATAQKVSDAEFNRTMANFYTERVMVIDHTIEWWEYADAKQKQYDHQVACATGDMAVDEARAVANAEIERYRSLQSD